MLFCNNPKLQVVKKDGEIVTLPICGDRDCEYCTTVKLDRKLLFSLYQYTNTVGRTFMVTVRLGGYVDFVKVGAFERSVNAALKKYKGTFTWYKSYEQEKGLVHAHYGLFLLNPEVIDTVGKVFRKFGQKNFTASRCDAGVKWGPVADGRELLQYVSKIYWPTEKKCPIPKDWARSQQRWRRGHLTILRRLAGTI